MLAGYLAYRLFILVLPLVVVIVALAGFSDDTTRQATDHLKLGAALTDLIASAGQDAHQGRVALLITGLFALLWSAWGFLSALHVIFAEAWRIPIRRFPRKARSFLRFAPSLILFGLVLYLAALVRTAGTIAGLAGTLTAILSAFVGFAGLAWILPRRSREWFWILPGAIVGACCAVGLQILGTLYIPSRIAGASKTYGALGVTVTLFTYVFLLGLILVLVAVVNAVFWDLRNQEPPGWLRRIADRIPLSLGSAGPGFVDVDGAVEVEGVPPEP